MQNCSRCNQALSADAERCPSCGAWLSGAGQPAPVPDEELWQQQVRRLLQAGQKIAAIQLYREQTGAGLYEAKQAVENMERGAQVQHAAAESSHEADLLSLLARGQKIAAIKAYRERTGCGLKEAKQAVEALAVQHGLAGRKTGCGATTALLLLAGGVLYSWWWAGW